MWAPALVLAASLLTASGAKPSPPAPNDPCEKPPPKMDGVLARGVNSTIRSRVLRLHNSVRQRVAAGEEERGEPGPQPPAGNMGILRWDKELAQFAQLWADQRIFEHNPCRKTKKFPIVGENLAMQYSTASTMPKKFGWKKVVMDWQNEVSYWPNNMTKKYKYDSGTGHYTQLVWAETKRVGCGYTAFERGNYTYHLFVCNYGPSGNVIGKPVYEEGDAATLCRKRRADKRFPSLCYN